MREYTFKVRLITDGLIWGELYDENKRFLMSTNIDQFINETPSIKVKIIFDKTNIITEGKRMSHIKTRLRNGF